MMPFWCPRELSTSESMSRSVQMDPNGAKKKLLQMPKQIGMVV